MKVVTSSIKKFRVSQSTYEGVQMKVMLAAYGISIRGNRFLILQRKKKLKYYKIKRVNL